VTNRVKKPRRRYTKEFKLETVRLVVEQGRTQADVARDLGINSMVLSRWMREFEQSAEQAFPGKGRLKPQDQRIKDLEEENRRLRMERDFLKKATAYFAKLPE
jgi:transposase